MAKTEFSPVAPTFRTPEQLQNSIDKLNEFYQAAYHTDKKSFDPRVKVYEALKSDADLRFKELQEQNARLAEVNGVLQRSGR